MIIVTTHTNRLKYFRDLIRKKFYHQYFCISVAKNKVHIILENYNFKPVH